LAFLNSKKGFLGPIGDDLPSLIPLVFALTIFFYVFTFTWTAFDEKNQSFDREIALLRVASTLKSNSYVSNYSQFVERCEEAKGFRMVNFKAGLLELPVKLDEHFEGIDVEKILSQAEVFFEDPFTGDIYKCGNVDGNDKIMLESVEIRMRFFPIALERDYKKGGNRHFFVKPMLLVVVAW
jgi:hypothetical protein